MGFTIERLVGLRRHRWARELLLLYGIDIPAEVRIGDGVRFAHRGLGTVMHRRTRVGDRVTIYHQVTIGRADGHLAWCDPEPGPIVEIGDDVVLFPGAKILGGSTPTRVGRGTVVAANAVLTRSTGEWEVWAGIPARKVADRPLSTGDDDDDARATATAGTGVEAVQ